MLLCIRACYLIPRERIVLKYELSFCQSFFCSIILLCVLPFVLTCWPLSGLNCLTCGGLAKRVVSTASFSPCFLLVTSGQLSGAVTVAAGCAVYSGFYFQVQRITGVRLGVSL